MGDHTHGLEAKLKFTVDQAFALASLALQGCKYMGMDY